MHTIFKLKKEAVIRFETHRNKNTKEVTEQTQVLQIIFKTKINKKAVEIRL